MYVAKTSGVKVFRENPNLLCQFLVTSRIGSPRVLPSHYPQHDPLNTPVHGKARHSEGIQENGLGDVGPYEGERPQMSLALWDFAAVFQECRDLDQALRPLSKASLPNQLAELAWLRIGEIRKCGVPLHDTLKDPSRHSASGLPEQVLGNKHLVWVRGPMPWELTVVLTPNLS
jgi:hypothetical protein